MKQLATVHVPASTAKDLNLDYREHPEDLNLGSLNYKSSNLQSSQTHCLIPKSPQSAMFACEYFWIATKTRQGLDDVKSLNLPLQKCPQ